MIRLLNKFNFSYNFLIECGYQLGGNIKRCFLRNSSVIYAQKISNFIIKISITSIQLKKTIKLMSRYIRKKSTIYFVHSHFGFKLLMKQLFDKTNMFYFISTRKNLLNINNLKSNITKQLKKLFFISSWKPGFLTNRLNFFSTRLNKKLKIKLPKFGFLNDYKTNKISLKEFKYSCIPYSNVINLNASSTYLGYLNIPGNSISYDSFFLICI